MLETSIELRGREIKLKPSHKAIFAIEDETGLAVYDLVVNHNLKIKEIASILYNCAKEAHEDITRGELAELLVGHVSPLIMFKCNELMNSVFADPSTDKKKEDTKLPEANA